ncbi:MAG: class I SAM-dependent methyltransferase [Patescibacteria group bacterium]
MKIKNILLLPLRLFFDKIFLPVYKKRLAKAIASLCEDNSYILDFGCDDGSTAEMIMKFNPSLKIAGIDVQNNRPAKIPKKTYDGKKIPYADNTFDIVLSLEVLHHTKDITGLIEEMKRVSKKYIIIKDHTIYSIFSRWLICFTDFTSNLPYGIKCAFNFLTQKQWDEIFKGLDLKIVEKPKKLNFGFGINERYNPIFKLQK